jgi:PAS domain S-box-containing protein
MSSFDELKAENARLAARVAELESRLAERPIDRASLYRMTDAAPWGALVISSDRRLDYANPPFERWLLKPPPAMGELAGEVVAPALLEILEAPIASALAGEPKMSEHQVADVSGALREIRLFVAPRGSAMGVTGCVVTLYDVTETRALDRSARENEARLARINAVIPSIIYITDIATGVPVWVGGRTTRLSGVTPQEFAQRPTELIQQIVHPDDMARIRESREDLVRRPDGEVVEVEFRVRRGDGAFAWVLDRAVVFERAGDGSVTRILSALIDIDDRKRAEERRTMLINELNHRVKNTLASVQSIARQTLSAGRPADQTIDIFTDRLVALSAAHDVLTRENWQGANLREIAERALRPFEAHGEGRLLLAGPEVRLDARAAVALAMALHELATNAVKYGALSGSNGEVRLAWRTRRDAGGGQLELEWRESGGPPVAPPTRRGFGSRLLAQGLPAELDGVAELEFAPEGLAWRVTAPVEAGMLLHSA